MLDAAARALTTQQAELVARQSRLNVLAPGEGIVLPPGDAPADGQDFFGNPSQLTPGVGTPSNDRFKWRRIATTNRVHLSLRMNAHDHRDAQVGCPIRFTVPGYSAGFYCSEIASVSPLHSSVATDAGSQSRSLVSHADAIGENHVYQAVCEVPETVDFAIDSLAQWSGAICHVVVHLPPRPLWVDLWELARTTVGI